MQNINYYAGCFDHDISHSIKKYCAITRDHKPKKNTFDYIKIAEVKARLSPVDAELTYLLSQSHDVMLTPGSNICLWIDCKPEVTTVHKEIQYDFASVGVYEYIKYKNQNLNSDLRSHVLPGIDVLEYNCPPDNEYVNLPNISSRTISVGNGSSKLIKLTPKQYGEYMKIHPKYLHNHKYIKIENGKVVIDRVKYCKDHCKNVGESRYYFDVVNRHMKITYGVVQDYALTPEIVNHFIGQVDSANYEPSSITSMGLEIEEVKQLISVLNVGLEINFKC